MNQNPIGMKPPQQMPQLAEVNKKNEKIFLIIGVIVAIIHIVIRLLKLPIVDLITQITVFTVIVSFILLFIKKYRYIGRKYLLGLFGTLIGVAILGFLMTFILVALRK